MAGKHDISPLACPHDMMCVCFCASRGTKTRWLPVSALAGALRYWQMGTLIHQTPGFKLHLPPMKK